MEPSSFGERIAPLSGKIDEAFTTISAGLEEIHAESDDYRNFLLELLGNVHYMFNLSFHELALFTGDGDQAHLRRGRMLAQRAEVEYIDIMKMLRADSTLNPFAGEPNVLGSLASLIIEGKLGREGYLEKLQELENLLGRQIEKAGSLVKEGLGKARKYEGTDETFLQAAMQDLSIAADLLARAVLNLHNPDEVKKVVDEMVKKTIETVQGKTE